MAAAPAQQDGRIRHVIVSIRGVPTIPQANSAVPPFGHRRGWLEPRAVTPESGCPLPPQRRPKKPGRRRRARRARSGRDRDNGRADLAALHRVTKTVPIVCTLVTDPVADGFVASLAHLRAANITGFAVFMRALFRGEMAGDALLEEVVRGMTGWLLCRTPIIRPGTPTCGAIRRRRVGYRPSRSHAAPVNSAAEIARQAIDGLCSHAPTSGLLLLPSPVDDRSIAS